MWVLRIGITVAGCIFTSVFHRILDFKNGAGFPSSPFFFLGYESTAFVID
jgi:hypothetical protein